MKIEYQKTLTKPVLIDGVGLHTGKFSKMSIFPASNNFGIIFKRTVLSENNLIKANYKNVTSAKLCTTLENKYGVKVSTVEHLLAAFYFLGIDNALIEINCEEVPIMDGSAEEFIRAFKNVEIKTLSEKRKIMKVIKKFELVDGKRRISIEPSKNFFEVDFQLDYKNEIIGKQRNIINFQKDNLKEVMESRTFCLFEDIEKIKKAGLAKGGSLENAIVIKNDEVLNSGGLRNKKEFVNHKILDLAGDFLLSEYRIMGKVKCIQGGHELTNMFLRKLFKQSSIFTIVESSSPSISKDNTIKPSIKLAVNA